MGRKRVEVNSGDVFSRLTVLEELSVSAHGNRRVLCKCECGEEKVFLLSGVRSGNTKSCGCLKREYLQRKNSTHGMSGTPLYRVWCQMKQRCENDIDKAYKNYGERGITVSGEWKEFEVFYKWAIESGYEKGLTIERVDVNGNYSPKNCVWIPFENQSKNRRTNNYITFNGETKTLSQWSRDLKINRKTICDRLRSGWTEYDALTKPVKTKENAK